MDSEFTSMSFQNDKIKNKIAKKRAAFASIFVFDFS